jgi:hypothetical protein
LQYVQDRLQRRIGIIWAMIGWRVDKAPLAIKRSSLSRRSQPFHWRRTRNPKSGIRNLPYLNTSYCGYRTLRNYMANFLP